MMPVAPTPKKSSSFTIESLVGKKDTSSTPSSTPTSKTSPASSSSSPPEAASPRGTSTSPHSGHGASPPTALRAPRDGPFTSGLHSSFHPVTPNGAKTLFPEVPFPLESLPPHFHGHLGIPAAHTPPHLGPLGPGGLAPHHQAGLPSGLHHHPFFMGASRDSFPFYPWLLSRNGGFLHHRFTGPDAGLLLQPFRKPKRIRTAFSPSQLLRLEHAFEKNHYVVGQERKELAANLSLTETQVKVWFQNRRTKYKRLKAEEAESRGGKEAADDSDTDHVMLEDSREEEEEEEGVEEDDEIEEMMPEEIDIESRINERDTENRNMEGSPTTVAASTSAMSQITDAARKTSHHLNRWRVETNLL